MNPFNSGVEPEMNPFLKERAVINRYTPGESCGTFPVLSGRGGPQTVHLLPPGF